jgi:hypothetical protein
MPELREDRKTRVLRPHERFRSFCPDEVDPVVRVYCDPRKQELKVAAWVTQASFQVIRPEEERIRKRGRVVSWQIQTCDESAIRRDPQVRRSEKNTCGRLGTAWPHGPTSHTGFGGVRKDEEEAARVPTRPINGKLPGSNALLTLLKRLLRSARADPGTAAGEPIASQRPTTSAPVRGLRDALQFLIGYVSTLSCPRARGRAPTGEVGRPPAPG